MTYPRRLSQTWDSNRGLSLSPLLGLYLYTGLLKNSQEWMNAQEAPQNLPHGYVWPLKFLHWDISTHHHLEQPGIFRTSVIAHLSVCCFLALQPRRVWKDQGSGEGPACTGPWDVPARGGYTMCGAQCKVKVWSPFGKQQEKCTIMVFKHKTSFPFLPQFLASLVMVLFIYDLI